jgi:VCBS repeat-containing protein
MAQSIAFGVYKIELNAGGAQVLDQVGQVIADVDLKVDAAAKIPLPDGHVLDVARLISVLGSGAFAELSGSGTANFNLAPVTVGSGMFFNSGFSLAGFDDQNVGHILGDYSNLGKSLGVFDESTTLSGFSELQVLQPTDEPAAVTPPTPHEAASFLPLHVVPTQQPASGGGFDPHAPIALDESLTGFEDQNITRQVTATDPDGNPVTYSLLHGPRHGSLVFNADGTFTYTPSAHYHGADSFTYQASDGSHVSNPGTVSLLVTPANVAPVIAVDEALTLAEGSALAGSVIASDLNGDPLTYTLLTAPQHGTVTFHADGTFTYTPTGGFSGADTFTFKASDGSHDSNAGTVSLLVTPVNHAPTAADEGLAAPENTILNGSVTATDVNGDPLGYSLVSGPTHGSIVFNADGTFTYTPSVNYHGNDSFTYKANDGSLDSNIGTVTLTLTSVNQAPVASDENLVTAESTVLTGAVVATDYNGDPLSYSLVTGPAHGSVTIHADGTFTYTPTAGYFGADSFTYRASDGSLNSNAGQVALLVTPANHAPVASDEALTTPEGAALLGGVTASDPNGDHLTYSLVSGPAHGTVVFNSDGTFTYMPATNYHGADSFTYQASDGSLASNNGTVSLLVTPINHAPVASDQTVSMAEDHGLTGAVTAGDLNGDPLTYALVGGPAHGTLTFNTDGTYSYTPAADYNGADSFTYKANDGSLDSNIATVSLTVTPVNDAPVAAAAVATTLEDVVLTGTVTATDVDNPVLTYALVSGPAHGTLTFHTDGTYSYTPAANYNGADSFTYKASDGSLNSNTATVNLTITAVNDAPVATVASVTTAEDTGFNNHVTATDVEGDPLTYSLVSGPAHGTLTFNTDGTYSYTPAADYNGADSFTYKANDGSLDSYIATVSLTVTPVNDAPVAAVAVATTLEDVVLTGTVTATDVDNPVLTYALVSGPAHGTLTFQADGSYSYTPAANYNGTDSFTYKANDGSLNSNTATVNLTITAVNDAPVATVASVTTAEDTGFNNHVTATDVEGDPLTYSLVSGPAHGTLTFNTDGTYSYTPAADYNGADSFTYKANDGSLDSNTATVSLTVTPVNDAPVAAGAAGTTLEDTVLNGHVTATDVDGDALSYSLVSGPAHGSLTFNTDGTYSYTPAADYNGADSFTYKANDGSLNSNTATVNLTVTAVNDAPTGTADSNTAVNHVNQLSATYNPLGNTAVGDYVNLLAGTKVLNYPTLANGIDPAGIVLAKQANVTATYVETKGGYHSMIGTYVVDASGHIDASSVKFLWLDSTSATKNQIGSPLIKDFLGNSQPLSVSLGSVAAGSHLGTFMISNGANTAANVTAIKGVAGVNVAGDNYAADLALVNAKTSITFDGAGVGHITVNGTTLAGTTLFSTNPTWNGDYATHPVQHFIAGVNSTHDGQLYVGYEDAFFDKNYNDNGAKFDIGDYNLSALTAATIQPTVHLTDVDSANLSQAVIDTHGFALGDLLHVPASGAFSTVVTQSGNDYHVVVTANAGTDTVANFEAYLNSVFFSSTSKVEGARTMDYTITDDQHATSSVIHGSVTVQSSYDISASMLTGAQTMLGAGDDHLRLDAALGHAVDMGAGNNTVAIETNNGSFGHSQANLLTDVQHVDTTGFGTNAVTLDINDVLHVTDGGHHLAIVGDAADSVTLNNDGSGHHWQLTDTHGGSNFYTWSDPAHAAVVEVSTLLHQTAN